MSKMVVADSVANYQATRNGPYTPLRSENKKSEQDFTYEHFPVVCPTCKGLGKIVNEDEGMVTFVPVKDERLRPAWMKLKIISLLAFILGAGGLCTYFLYPREVTMHVVDHKALYWDFSVESPWIVIEFNLLIHNKNFFAVSLNNTKIQVLYQQTIVSKMTVNSPISVGLRTYKKAPMIVNITYDASQPFGPGRYMKRQCFEKRMYVAQVITATAELSYWIHDEHIESVDDYFFIDCSNMLFPLPTAKPTTKPPHPTTHASVPHPTSTQGVEITNRIDDESATDMSSADL